MAIATMSRREYARAVDNVLFGPQKGLHVCFRVGLDPPGKKQKEIWWHAAAGVRIEMYAQWARWTYLGMRRPADLLFGHEECTGPSGLCVH